MDISPSTVADAIDSAAERVKSLLRQPSDLHQVEQLKQRFTSERSSKEAQLKAAVRHHLDSATFALYLMQHSLQEFDSVTLNFKAVENLVSQSQAQLSAYPIVKSVYSTHRNFAAALQLHQELETLAEKIKQIDNLLAEDSKNIMQAHNLLFTYLEVYKLEQLRDATISRAMTTNVSASARKELEQRFQGVQVVANSLEQMLWNLSGKLLQLTRRHGSTIVKIAKIIEFAEKADQIAEKKGLTIPKRRFKEKFFDRLMRAIEEQFEGGVAQFAESEDVDATLRSLNFMIDDLTLVLDEVSPRFSPTWDVFLFYVKAYHRQMSLVLMDLVRSRRDPKEILMLFSWVELYYKNLKSRLGVEPEALTPRLLDEQIPKLTSDYVQLVHSKVAEWTENLASVETKDFKVRDKPPEQDSNQLYFTSAPVILFQMMNQQVDLAATSGREQLMVDVIIECCDIMLAFQDHQTDLVKSEQAIYIENKDEAAGGIIEYLIAMVNNQAKSSEFTLQLIERIKRDVRGHAALIVEKRLSDVEDGFRAVAKISLNMLLNIIFLDVNAMLESCFTARWYEEDFIEHTIATLEDYSTDLQQHLTEYFFNKFMYECLDCLLITYISAATSKYATFRVALCPKKMEADIKAISEFFSRFLIEKRVTKSLQVLHDLCKLVSGEISSLPLHVLAMKAAYRDASPQLYEKLLAKRSDFSRDKVQKTMSEVANAQLLADGAAFPAGPEETLLGKVKFV